MFLISFNFLYAVISIYKSYDVFKKKILQNSNYDRLKFRIKLILIDIK